MKKKRKRESAKKSESPIQRFLALSDVEKDQEVAEFETAIDRSQWKPLSVKQRKLWQKVQRSMGGRPRRGEGAKMVAVTIEKGLLKRVDEYARQHDLKRAEMIARGLEIILKAG
jgi:hypothetical protein